MTPLFEPKGEKPEWRISLDDELLTDAPSGTVITYEELDRVLGRDSRENRAPIIGRARSWPSTASDGWNP